MKLARRLNLLPVDQGLCVVVYLLWPTPPYSGINARAIVTVWSISTAASRLQGRKDIEWSPRTVVRSSLS